MYESPQPEFQYPQMAVNAPSFMPAGVKPFVPFDTQASSNFEQIQQQKGGLITPIDSNTEEDGVKYTCRYDIQIENEKEF